MQHDKKVKIRKHHDGEYHAVAQIVTTRVIDGKPVRVLTMNTIKRQQTKIVKKDLPFLLQKWEEKGKLKSIENQLTSGIRLKSGIQLT